MIATDIFELVRRNPPLPFSGLESSIDATVPLPLAWDAVGGFGAAMVLRGSVEQSMVDSYIADVTDPGGEAVMILHVSGTEELHHTPRSLRSGSALVDVVAQSASMLSTDEWIGMVHLTVHYTVRQVLSDSRPIGIGAGGNVCVLWLRERPTIVVRAGEGDGHTFQIAPA